MRKVLVVILCILFNLSVVAQDEVLLNGKLLSEDSTGIEMINILNLTHKYGTTSDYKGEFTLPVYKGDTVLFSAIQYKNIEIVITDSLLEMPFIEFILDVDNITLNDIVLTDGFSMLDTTAKTFGKIDMGLPFNTVPVKKKYSDRKEAYLTSKLSSVVLSAITGELKKLREIQEMEKDINLSEHVKDIFDDKFYNKLGIKQEDIYLFIEFYMHEARTKGLLKPQKQYELIKFIEGKSIAFLKRRASVTDTIPSSD